MESPTIEQPPAPRTKTPWYKRKSFVLFALGFITAVLLITAFQVVRDRLASETKISCHQPTTQSTQLPYCVYYKNNRLLIGSNNDRGLSYTIPYDVKDISVNWDNDTDALTVTMPGTKLVVQSSEYVDER